MIVAVTHLDVRRGSRARSSAFPQIDLDHRRPRALSRSQRRRTARSSARPARTRSSWRGSTSTRRAEWPRRALLRADSDHGRHCRRAARRRRSSSPTKTRLGAELDAVVGHSTVPLDADSGPAARVGDQLGDLVADAMRARRGRGHRDRQLPAASAAIACTRPARSRGARSSRCTRSATWSARSPCTGARRAAGAQQRRVEDAGGRRPVSAGVWADDDASNPGAPSGNRVSDVRVNGAAARPDEDLHGGDARLPAEGRRRLHDVRRHGVLIGPESGDLLVDGARKLHRREHGARTQIEGRITSSAEGSPPRARSACGSSSRWPIAL